MDEHTLRRMLEGGGGLSGALARLALWFPGRCYGSLMELRRTAHMAGLLQSVRVDAPVVSVGNLTAGGSGKTPLVALLARALSSRGHKPGILLRGYKTSVEGISDEAVLYGTLCPDAIVRTGSDRVASAEKAIAEGAAILLLDDGFQHLRIKRDMDIVLVDATAPWGGGNTIPGGLLREPRAALRFATAVVVTRSDQAADGVLEPLMTEIARLAPHARIFKARHRPSRLTALDGSVMDLERLQGKKVLALSGIARPEAFRKTLESIGAVVAEEVTGGDHHHFTRDQIETVLRRATDLGLVVVTTEKDRAKFIFGELADNNVDNYNVWTLGVDQEVDDFEALMTMVERVVARFIRSGR